MSSNILFTWTDFGAILGSITGVAGTILAIIGLHLRHKEKKIIGKLRVSLPVEPDNEKSIHSIKYEVINKGSIPFYLKDIGIRVDKREIKKYQPHIVKALISKQMCWLESLIPLPYELKPKNSWLGSIVDYRLNEMRIHRFEAFEKTGKTFKSSHKNTRTVIKQLKKRREIRFKDK